MALKKLGKLAKDALLGDGTVEPFRCRICGQWSKRGSKAKGVCKNCYEKLE